ncbi:MAG: glycosyltransferase family 4 protein [Vicinamibacteraceae bacterium]
MRVGIDGRAFRSPAFGVRRYVWELTRALTFFGPAVEVVAIGSDPTDPLPRGIQRAGELPSPPTNFGRHVFGLPIAVARRGLDVFHAPAYTAPCWGQVPIVLSLHDVSYARHPEWYPYRRDRLRRAFYAWSARRARLILTDSEFSRREIVAAYGIREERIRVIPLGVAAAFSPGVTDHDDWHASVREQPYVLHVGDLHERRNALNLVRAVAMVSQRQPSATSPRLILAGTDRGSGDALRREAKALHLDNVLDMTGAVSEDHLLALYRGASVLVCASRYEGFGFPVLEAMACGVPVIAARAGALPEVTGDAAVLIDPDDVPALADAIEALLWNRDRAVALRQAGLQRARQFTWRHTAEATLEAYRACADRERAR